jgi:hypothetical protein
LDGGRVALVAGHDVDLVRLHLTVEPHLGLALDQTLGFCQVSGQAVQ